MSEEQYFVPIGVVEVEQSADAEFGAVYICTQGKLMKARDIRDEEPRWEDITPPGTRVIYREFIDNVPQPDRTRLLEIARDIGRDMASQYFGTSPKEIGSMGESPTEQDVMVRNLLIEALSALRHHKPQERSEKSRRYAVTITEMEKACAYFNAYVCTGLEING